MLSFNLSYGGDHPRRQLPSGLLRLLRVLLSPGGRSFRSWKTSDPNQPKAIQAVTILQRISTESELGLPEQTVHWHVKEIYAGLKVHSRAELFAYFRRLQLDVNSGSLMM